MKLQKLFVTLLLLLGLAACSNTETKDGSPGGDTVKDEWGGGDDADFIVDSEDEDLDSESEPGEGLGSIAEVGEDKDEEVDDEEVTESPVAEVSNESMVAKSEPVGDDSYQQESASPQISENSSGRYTVESGDTLMYVAFKVWGDYSRWRELARSNNTSGGLKKGMIIHYTPNGFSWAPKGNPHLIKTGETLGLISSQHYNSQRRWKDIWDNNRQMIRDPNLIFAGFTLYYIPDGQRETASEL